MLDDFTSCASCQYNNGEKCELFGRVIGMHGCSSGVERKPRNNFERIKAMSLEELADYHGAETGQRTEDVIRWLKKEVE